MSLNLFQILGTSNMYTIKKLIDDADLIRCPVIQLVLFAEEGKKSGKKVRYLFPIRVHFGARILILLETQHEDGWNTLTLNEDNASRPSRGHVASEKTGPQVPGCVNILCPFAKYISQLEILKPCDSHIEE